MSAATYVVAMHRYRDTLNVFGARPLEPDMGRWRCAFSSHPDNRARIGYAVLGALTAGDDPTEVGADYLPSGIPSRRHAVDVLAVAHAALAYDPRLHSLTRAQARALDDQHWWT